MSNMGDLQTPFETPAMDAPSGASTGGGMTGGWDLGDGGQKESANMSSLPALQTTVAVGEGDPGPNGQVDWPPVASPGTVPTSTGPAGSGQ